MFCSNCGNQMKEDEKFCSNCGTPVGDETNSFQNTRQAQGTNFFVIQGNKKENPNLEKAKLMSKDYFSFLLSNLKAPLNFGLKVNQENWINSLITLIIFSILPGITAFIVASKIGSLWGSGPSIFNSFLLPVFYMAITTLIIIAVVFGVTRLMKSSVSFLDVLSRLGALFTIPAAMMLLSLLLILLNLSTLYVYFSMGYLFSMISSIAFIVYSYRDQRNEGIDPYYAVLLCYLGMGIAISLFWDKVFGSLIGF